MKMLKSISGLLLVMAISCTYKPEEIFFTEVQQVLPQTTISLNSYNEQDTIYLYEASNFQYSISTSVAIITSNVLMGSMLLHSSSKASGSFFIAYENLRTGTHELKIQFTSKSGTGSLADKKGIETVEVWRKWVLVIDVDPPPAPVIQTSKQNGFLKVSWTPFLKKNFRNYLLIKSGTYDKRLTITDPNRTSYIDSTYVGGEPVNFTVVVNTNLATAISNTVIVNDPQAISIKFNTTDSTAVVKWRKSKFEGAFKEVAITENDILRKTITNPNDTSLVLKLKEVIFGLASTISVTINAKYPYANYKPFSVTEYNSNPLGAKRTEPYQRLYYNKVLDAIMGYSSSYGLLRTYNNDLKVIDSIRVNGTLSMPYPGNYLYFAVSGGIRQVNLLTKETKNISTKGHYQTVITPDKISGASNQLVSYGLIDATYPWDNRYNKGIVDISSNTIIFQSDVEYDLKNGTYGPIFLSDDGRYAKSGQAIFTTTGNTLTQSAFLNSVAYDFRPDNNDELIFRGTPTTIIRTSDLTTLRTLSPPVSGYFRKNYDPATKTMLYMGEGAREVYLINIDTQVVTSVKALSNNCVNLVNGVLFDVNGYFLKVM
jgi:hypothetical protein